jgi:indolepyruvate ferredoxin oxidoreductase alpha subunit
MGASIGVAHGALRAGSPERHVAVLGDSTFFHSGIPPLVNAVYNRTPVITIIMDNRVTGMTGHQDNPGTGRTLQGEQTTVVEIEPVVRALGVRHVKTVPAYHVEEIEATLKAYMALDEPSVLITLEECALLPDARRRWVPLEVVSDRCNGCTLCFRIGCPAILKSDELDGKTQRPKALIDAALCTGCEVCAQICPRDAILFRAGVTES